MINDEIHVKTGGDHGQGSFKMSLQIGNVKCPNSKENTIVFNIFEAKDAHVNLKMTLTRFRQQINDLQKMTWK